MAHSVFSPRLVELQRQIEAGHAGALDTFWREVEERGAPLIEPIEDDDQNMLVTFLWRAGEEVRNVVVVGGIAGIRFGENQMEHVPNTDLWCRTYRARKDMRTTYWLAPNDSLVDLDEATDWRARTIGWQRDPLNPRTFVFPKDEDDPADQESVRSVLELPGAPPQPWIVPRSDVPAGQVELHRVHSETLGNEYRVWAYTPPNYTTSGEPYGLLLLFDGWACIHLIPAPTILDNLLAEDRIPPLIAIMPDSFSQEIRDRELACYPPFVDFLTEELMPWTRQHYHITSKPGDVIVGGSSLGGLAAAFAGYRRADMFGNVLSQSGSFGWKPDDDPQFEWLTRQFAVSPALPLQFYLDTGLLETIAWRSNRPSGLAANRHLRDVLQAKGYPVHYAEFSGGHDYLRLRGTLADGLIALTQPEHPDAK